MQNQKDLKYPIKYAIMPIKEQIGWSHSLHELETEYDVVANIVTKCYVIGERKKYSSTGNIEIKYEVVFLYNKSYTNFNEIEPTIPEYNLFTNECVNSVFVSQLFDSYEDALSVATQYNDKILHNKIARLSFDSTYKEKLKKITLEHQKNLDKYKKIEEKIEAQTRNSKITKMSTLEEIIEKIIAEPSEFYIKIASSLSFEEREYLKQLIKNKSCHNCTNSSCKVESCEKVGLNELGMPEGSTCVSWNNYKLIGRQRILTKN